MEEKVVRRASKSVSPENMCCMHGNGCCSGHHFSFIRIFLGIVLLLFVFCGGFKLGVLIGFIGSSGMNSMMWDYDFPQRNLMRYHKAFTIENVDGGDAAGTATATKNGPIER
jgi:hypothetical protein